MSTTNATRTPHRMNTARLSIVPIDAYGKASEEWRNHLARLRFTRWTFPDPEDRKLMALPDSEFNAAMAMLEAAPNLIERVAKLLEVEQRAKQRGC